MTDSRDDRIRERAYEIWQREGSRDGVALDHWIEAQCEVDGRLGAAAKESRDPDDLANRPPPPS